MLTKNLLIKYLKCISSLMPLIKKEPSPFSYIEKQVNNIVKLNLLSHDYLKSLIKPYFGEKNSVNFSCGNFSVYNFSLIFPSKYSQQNIPKSAEFSFSTLNNIQSSFSQY